MADDDNRFCMWEERATDENGHWGSLCHHPMGKEFCDYTNDENEQDECPLYAPIRESSNIEEEVRQYLEYTEPTI